MKKRLLIFAILAVSLSNLFAQTKQQLKIADELFKDTKEIYFEFNYSSKAQLSELTKIISLDHGMGVTAKAFANKNGFIKFLQYNIPYTILKRPNELANVTMVKNGEQFRAAVSAYPTYPAYIAMMQQFAIDYPTLCTYYDLGTLPSGRKIVILKISDNPGMNENEPAFLYTSTMHGDEATGYPMMLSLIDHLLSNYGTNARITNMVNSIEIWINPLANPDGAYAGGDATISGAIRFNANGADLNRNYPDPQDGLHPDGLAFQPETEIFMGFADSLDFVMSANFHGGAEVANYPWDTWNLNHADENWWSNQCQRYADSCQLYGSPGYFNDLYSGTIPGVTNGFDWYEVNGGRQDYMQWWHQCKEFTVELSAIKLIPDAQLVDHFNYNLPSLLNYMEESLHGIRGIITNQCTGQPIRAKVFISGHDYDSSHVYSSADVGNYHRPIFVGTYNVTYSALGFASQTISGINIATPSSTVVQNIALVPLAPTTNFTSTSAVGCTGTIDFTDLTGSAATWAWDFGDGNTSILQNPTHTYTATGTYTVTLTTTNCAGSDAEVKINYLTLTVATAPLTVNDTTFACVPTTFNLSASGTGTLNWFDAPIAGALVNTGTAYTTPTLSATTGYFVESLNPAGSLFVGALNNTIGTGGYYTAGTYHYLQFDATTAFTLIKVKVYANTTGNRTIQLRNSSGTVLQAATILIPSGLNTITLNFSVPVGTGLQLGTAGGITNNLYRNSSGASYPYNIAGTVSITGNSAGNPAYYYYFYDWEISSTCNSARTPVYAVFNSAIGAPSVNASASSTSICDGTNVIFNATPTNGGSTPSYQWQVNGLNVGTDSPTYSNANLNNGDVVTCTMTSSDVCVSPSSATSLSITMTVFALPGTPTINFTSPDLTSSAGTGNQWYFNGVAIGGANGVTYTPTANGLYYVIVTDVNGCTSDTSNQLNLTTLAIKELSQIGFSLFPNPATASFTVETNFIGNYTLTIIDNLGQKVIVESCTTQRETINLNGLQHGIYFVQLKTKDGFVTKKLMVK